MKTQTSIFDAAVTIQPARIALTHDDLVDLWACELEVYDDNQLVPENAEPPDGLEAVCEWVLP